MNRIVTETGTVMVERPASCHIGMLNDCRSCEAIPPLYSSFKTAAAKLEECSAAPNPCYNGECTDWVNTDIDRSRPVADQISVAPRLLCVGGGCATRRRIATDSNRTHAICTTFQSAVSPTSHKGATSGTTSISPCITIPPSIRDRADDNGDKGRIRRLYEEFGPYQFHQTSFLEFPGYADFAESYPTRFPGRKISLHPGRPRYRRRSRQGRCWTTGGAHGTGIMGGAISCAGQHAGDEHVDGGPSRNTPRCW